MHAMALRAVPKELSAFTDAGWGLEAPDISTAARAYVFQPPTGTTPQSASTEVPEAHRSLGIAHEDNICALWLAKRREVTPQVMSDTDPLFEVKMALRHSMAAIAGSRIAVTALQHSGWCLAALQGLETCLKALKAGFRNRQLWPDYSKDSSPEASALKAAVKGIMSPFQTCLEILDDFPVPDKTHIDPESVVYMVANLDSMYYVLLDHHLTASWATPSIPPPHRYFPALVEVIEPEVKEAVTSLMDRGGPASTAAFRAAWDLSEDLEFPEDVDPLRVVMWARWREAAVLLFHRGLGTNGEMDAALEEEARFKTWMENNSSHRDSPDPASRNNYGCCSNEPQQQSNVAGSGNEEGGPSAPSTSCQRASGQSQDPNTIGGISTSELDHAIQAALGASGDDLSDVEEELGEDEALDAAQLEQLAGLSLGASDAGTATALKPPPTAYTALQAFRETAREWPCHLYAFAAPNNRALKALADEVPIVEVGAGVGYWALLLKQAGVSVTATDELPTESCTEDTVNKYHGRIPPLTEVTKAQANITAAQHRDSTLFICYAPPDSSMAEEALEAYEGNCVAVVGEWDGDTGTAVFARSLLTHWDLQEAIPLPNWSDTAHDLTIWRRKPEQQDNIQPSVPWPVCSATGASFGQCLEETGSGLKRCRHLRSLLFKDGAAFEKYRPESEQALALSFVFFQRPLQLDSSADFDSVSIL